MKMKYTKMQSNGNDFLITENISFVDRVVELADRKKGVGFDQLLLVKNSTEFELKVFNADGSEANNCINGLRCVGQLYNKDGQTISISEKKFKIIFSPEGVGVEAEKPIVKRLDEYFIVNFANNHIIKESYSLNEAELPKEYLALKKDQRFKGVKDFNLSYFQRDGDIVLIRTFENGVGETQSCGSASIATAAVISQSSNKKIINFSAIGGPSAVFIRTNSLVSVASVEEIHMNTFNE